jgi:hypothetical protein
MAYAPNFLCIREGVLLAVEVDRAAKDVLVTFAAKVDMAPEQYGALYDLAKRDYPNSEMKGSSSRTRRRSTGTISIPSRSISGISPGDTGQPTV